VQGTLNLLEAARGAGPPHCLVASTGSVYGQSTPVPFLETASADQPLAPYPASKRAMELFAHSYHHLWQMPVTVLRFFNVYGPHGRPDMMPWRWTLDILTGRELTLFNGGRLKRDWTYIDDIIAGFLAALDSPCGYRVYNLGCGHPVENIAFVQILEKLLDRPAHIQAVPAPLSEPPVTYADIGKAVRELGYRPQVQVEEGLRRFIAWLRREHLVA
jgi:UDP-glucuronate 4-epimerase